MAKFALYLNAGEGGCDYTVGCNQVLHELKSDSLEEAVTKLPLTQWFAEKDACDARAKSAEVLAAKRAKLEQLKRELGET